MLNVNHNRIEHVSNIERRSYFASAKQTKWKKEVLLWMKLLENGFRIDVCSKKEDMVVRHTCIGMGLYKRLPIPRRLYCVIVE